MAKHKALFINQVSVFYSFYIILVEYSHAENILHRNTWYMDEWELVELNNNYDATVVGTDFEIWG